MFWKPKPLVKCPYCGKESKSFKSNFSWGILICLLIFGVLPGVIYWVLMKGKVRCPECGTSVN
jgi:transcription elongation factor Elf1